MRAWSTRVTRRSSPRTSGLALVPACLALVATTAVIGAEPIVLSCQFPGRTLDVPVSDNSLTIVPASASTSILVLDENGADIEWRLEGDASFRPIANRPPRLGSYAFPVSNTTQLEIRKLQSGAAKATLICHPSAAEGLLPACLQRAEMTAMSGNESLSNRESNPICAAFMQHAIAHASSMAENAERAEMQYRNAIQRWDAVGDMSRGAAARLGLVEQLVRRQKFADAISAAGNAEQMARKAQLPYFALRARQESCLATRYLGDWQGAIRCLRPIAREFLNIGEAKDAGNAAVSLGDILRVTGDSKQASQWLEQARRILSEVSAPLAQARMHQLAGSIDSDSGHVGAALSELHLASELFAAAKNQLGEGNSLLRIGNLFSALDSYAEADAYFAIAKRKFEAIGADERIAATRVAQAELWWRNARFEDADRELDYAQDAFSRLTMPMERQWVLAKRLGLQSGRVQTSANIKDSRAAENSGPYIGNEWMLAAAKQALDSGDARAVNSAMRGLHESAMTLPQWSAWQGLVISSLIHDGELQTALAALERAATRIRALAQRGASPLVRAMTMTQLGPLQSAWLDALPQTSKTGSIPMDVVWRTLMLSDRSLATSDAWQEDMHFSKQRTGFERALNDAMLTEAGPADELLFSAQQQLVAELGGESPPQATSRIYHRTSLTQLQARLTDQQQLLWFAIGEKTAWIFSITRNRAELLQTADPDQLRTRSAKLIETLSNPMTPERDVLIASEQLSAALLPATIGAPAKHLLLVVDPRLNGVPFALLHWPNTQGYLIEQSSLSYLTRIDASEATTQEPGKVSIFVSAASPEAASLPDLALAGLEPDLISRVLPERVVDRWIGNDFTRQRLDAALRRDAAWVHVAAHGAVPFDLIGFSGIWVSSGGDGTDGALLSWINLVATPLRAQLVVLNVCSLAGNAKESKTQSASTFARMLSVAGSKNVVAARWEVSDAATSIWVPSFYRTLAAQQSLEPAVALRDAQLDLRQSRHFRHPFYWAGLVHYARTLP